MKGKEPKRDDLFIEIALERGYLDETQAAACREDKAKLAEMGYSRSVIQLATEKGFVDKAKAQEIRREMQKRGVLPRVGGYELLSKLGQGGMGAVYKARQLSLDRLVALKILPPELAKDKVFLERFRREGLMAAKITHPNAVQVYDVGESGGRHYLVMEYVEGASADRLLDKGPLPEERGLGIVKGVLGALAAAHEAGIVHRDIKPSNILVGKDGFPKLADLGIARQAGFSGGTLTGTGAAIGTPQYMSPEQCRGEKDIDGRSDIYSLGATLYHLVCGKSPYGEADSALAIIQAHVSKPLPNPCKTNPALSPGMADLIKRMMAKEREDRPQDCASVLAEINQLEGAAQQQASAGTVGTPQPTAVPPLAEAKSTPPPPVTTPSAASPTQNPLATHAAAVAAALGRRKWALGIGAPLLALGILILAVSPGGRRGEDAPEPLADQPLVWHEEEEDALARAEEEQAALARAERERDEAEAQARAEAERAAREREEAEALAEAERIAQERTDATQPPMLKDWPFDAQEARRRQEETARALGISIEKAVDLGGGVRMVMVLIPAGEFMMGSPDDEEERRDNEGPQHLVRIEKPFYMGKHPVTQSQWQSVMGSNPARYRESGGNAPVERVSWNDCQEFVGKLSEKEGVSYRMPTEAEWEYACRAGITTRFYTGDQEADLDAAGWHRVNSGRKTQPVGLKQPNAWGLYDMHGNVWEWTQSLFQGYPYSATDGRESLTAVGSRVLRGGSWDYLPGGCRSAVRYRYAPPSQYYRGFRLSCPAQE